MYTIKEQKPTKEQWGKLYSLAKEIWTLGPWKWMYDSEIFALSDPLSKDFLYVSIMGNLGTHYAIGVYPGQIGYSSLDSLFSQTAEPDYDTMRTVDMLMSQRCIKLSFENISTLESHDIERAKEHRCIFGDMVAVFCSFDPGFPPWDINKQEASQLIIALEQTLIVVPPLKKNKNVFDEVPDNMLYTRLSAGKGWQSIVMPRPEPIELSLICVEDGIHIQKKEKEKLRGLFIGLAIWEVDLNFAGSPVDGRPFLPRPYFPKLISVVDHESQFIHHMKALSTHIGSQEVATEFIDACVKTNMIPKRVLVRDELIFDILSFLLSDFEVEVEFVDMLPATQGMLLDMDANMSGSFG